MKKFNVLLASAALTITASASPAFADTFNIAIAGVNTAQNVGPMVQKSVSASIAVGNTGVNAAQTSTALNAAAMSSITEDAVLNGGSMLTGNGVFDTTNQVVATANQTALSVVGSGAMGNGATQTSGAINLGAMSNVQVNVKFK